MRVTYSCKLIECRLIDWLPDLHVDLAVVVGVEVAHKVLHGQHRVNVLIVPVLAERLVHLLDVLDHLNNGVFANAGARSPRPS